MVPIAQRSRATPPTLSVDRNTYIDVLRGIAIFGVVCIHFGGSFIQSAVVWSTPFYLGLFLNELFSFAVPLFVFLSGLLSGSSSAGIWSYFRRRLVRVGVPYLAASAASFALLNHFAEWQALPDNVARAWWLVQRILYFGVEPTLYFIPLILQLYLLQPVLKALPSWCHRKLGGGPADETGLAATTIGLGLLFAALHVTIGMLSYKNIISYYNWCRPFPLFWLVYFFVGLHFSILKTVFSRLQLAVLVQGLFWISIVILAWSMIRLSDPLVVGENFGRNRIGYAYCRPEITLYNMSMVSALGLGVGLGWKTQKSWATFLGRFSLEIYVWHILLLYEAAWRFPSVLAACRQIPELILIMAAAACFAIAGFWSLCFRVTRLIWQQT